MNIAIYGFMKDPSITNIDNKIYYLCIMSKIYSEDKEIKKMIIAKMTPVTPWIFVFWLAYLGTL